MIKINGKTYNTEEDYFIKDLVNEGHLIKTGIGEYYWSKKHLRDTLKSMVKLRRYFNNPLWRIYYDLVGIDR